MQRNTPQYAFALPASHPKRLCGIIGESLAAFIVGLGLLLFLFSIALQYVDLGTILSIPLAVLLMVSPYLALVGGILCLIRLFFASDASWLTLTALFVHLGIVLLTISTLLVAREQMEDRVDRVAELDRALTGSLDREKGVYESPEKFFRIESPTLAGAVIIDQHDAKKRHVNALVTMPRVPRVMFEIAPQTETGISAEASQQEFVEFAKTKIKGTESSSEQFESPVGPAFRVAFKKKSEDGSMNRWLTDNFVLGGWWVRVSAYTLASEDAEADRKDLATFLQETWKHLSFNPPSPPVAPSKPATFDVPNSLANPLDQEDYIKVPESMKLPAK